MRPRWEALAFGGLALAGVGQCGPRALLGNGAGSNEFCRANETVCGGACVDTRASAAHCGACGSACGGGQVCDQGTCVATGCAAGRTACDGACFDLAVSVRHCGACGTRCNANQVCVAGACAAGCGAGELLCGDACIDPQTNARHCGACGTACGSGQSCVAGACVTGGTEERGGALCPHEPADFAPTLNTAWNELPASPPDFSAGGWQLTAGMASLLSIAQDSAAPRSPANVLRVDFPVGFAMGTAPAQLRSRALRANTGGFYACFALRVDPNLHPTGTDATVGLFGPRSSATPDLAHRLVLYAPSASGTLYLGAQLRYPAGGPASTTTLTMTAANNVAGGDWKRVEVLWLPNTPGQDNGTYRAWVDGESAIDVNNVRWFDAGQSARWNDVEIANTFDGDAAVSTATSLALDHLYVSVK